MGSVPGRYPSWMLFNTSHNIICFFAAYQGSGKAIFGSEQELPNRRGTPRVLIGVDSWEDLIILE